MGVGGKGRAGGWLAVLMVTTAVGAAGMVAVPAQAQPAPAAQGQVLAFDIPAQPLADALPAFGRQAGVQVSARGDAVAGVRTAGVHGTLSVPQALSQLLSGSGVTWRLSGTTVILERAAAPAGAMTLDPVTVEGGQGETAHGPVPGYVARHSATASKSDTPLLETPQSITVVGAEEMEARNVQTLEDAIKYTPGVNLSYGATGDNRSSWYQMRGFSVTTTFFRDGLKVSGQNWQRVDPYLLERVEILRGPASVLYGQNVPGGMVNSITKRPQDGFAAEAAVEYGTSDWKRVEADITGPLNADGTLLYRVTAGLHDSEGMNRIDHDRNERRMVAPSLTWTPREGTELTLSVVRQEDESSGWWPRMVRRTAAGKSDPSVYLGSPDYDDYRQEQTHVTLLGEHAVDDTLKLSLSARYSTVSLDYRQTWPGTVQRGGTTISRSNYAYQQDAEVYALDVRVEKKLSLLSTQHTLTGGFDYLYQNRNNFFGSATDYTVSLFNPDHSLYRTAAATSYSKGDERAPGVYGQDQIAIGDHWVVLLGGRVDLAGAAAGVYYDDTFTGRVGVAYKTGFGLVPYASYAESFEPQSGAGWSGSAFEPTTGRQYEVGVKYEPPGVNAIATLALFDLRKQNVLTTDPDPTHICNGSACSVQTGEVKSQGVEASLTMGLTEGLRMVASYTYNPVEVSKSNNAAEVGRQQANTPVHTAGLWLDYAVKDGPLAGLGVGGGLRFIGKTESAARDIVMSPQVLDEAMLRYDLEKWRLAVNVKNLFDREIDYNCTNSTYAQTCYVHEPLTVTARVVRKF